MRIDAMPRFRLFDDPSPFHRLPRFSEALGGQADIWIKREDLLPVAFGGNKLRNLEFLIGAALKDGADTIVTSGRRWSNHTRLTAAAGAMAGLDVHLVLSGPKARQPGPGIRIAKRFGATVHQLDSDERDVRARKVVAVTAKLHAEGRRPYVIGVGGAGPIGAVGQLLAGRELFAQVAEAGISVDRIVLPTATGGTQAGLTLAAAAASPSTSVLGVIVARTPAELQRSIDETIAVLSEPAGVTVPEEAVRFDRRQIGDGYGRPTEAGTAAADLLARTEGVLVDPIYTSKALASLIEAVRNGRHDGRSVVFWHAGGTTGILEPLD